MAKTPLGFEITDFLETFSGIGEREEAFDSFVRKYARFRKKEIRKEESKSMEPYRIRMIESISALILVLGWVGFFACVIYMSVVPILKNHGARLSEITEHMNASYASIFSAIAVALFCFAVHFKQVRFTRMVNFITALWSGFVIFARVSVMGPYMDINSPAWIIFGNLLVAFILINVLSSMFGAWLNRKLLQPDDAIRDMKHVFTPFEAVFLVIMILLCGAGMFFFVNISGFYRILDQFRAVRIITMAAPVVVFLIYCVWHANRMYSESVDAWFCASMEVYATTLILQIFAVKNILRGVFLWLALAAVCVIIIIYLGSIIGNTMSYLTILMIALNFIVSASINYYSEDAGVYVIGTATHWWMVAPAFVTVALAVGFTIREMIQEKL